MNLEQEIRDRLFRLQDTEYRDFQCRLIPEYGPDTMIGVRTPELRQYAKQLAKREDIDDFLHDLPHRYFDENQLHAFIISEFKDWNRCIAEVNHFLPYVDNWATCDQKSPKVFRKHRKELLAEIDKWVQSGRTYTVRFGIGKLMQNFLDEDYNPAYPETVASIRSDEYYVNMMIAWYFATALAKQYDTVISFLEEHRLDVWTHNKTIQKALESRRITEARKEYLKSLKRNMQKEEKPAWHT